MENQTPSPPTGQPVSGGAAPASSNSTKSVVALILGILSLTCCGFLSGIPAIIIGRSELKQIEEKKIPESNRTMAKVGMILGIVGSVLSCLGTLVYVALIALGISTGMMEGLSQ